MKNQVYALILMIVCQLVILSYHSLQLKLESTLQQLTKRKYLTYFAPQGHELDCINICKLCVQESVVKDVYDAMVDDNRSFSKKSITEEINLKIQSLKTSNPQEYIKVVSQSEVKANSDEDSGPNSVFRIYYDLCVVALNAFYA